MFITSHIKTTGWFLNEFKVQRNSFCSSSLSSETRHPFSSLPAPDAPFFCFQPSFPGISRIFTNRGTPAGFQVGFKVKVVGSDPCVGSFGSITAGGLSPEPETFASSLCWDYPGGILHPLHQLLANSHFYWKRLRLRCSQPTERRIVGIFSQKKTDAQP